MPSHSAEAEFEKYSVIQDRFYESDFDKEIKKLTHEGGKNNTRKRVKRFVLNKKRGL